MCGDNWKVARGGQGGKLRKEVPKKKQQKEKQHEKKKITENERERGKKKQIEYHTCAGRRKRSNGVERGVEMPSDIIFQMREKDRRTPKGSDICDLTVFSRVFVSFFFLYVFRLLLVSLLPLLVKVGKRGVRW